VGKSILIVLAGGRLTFLETGLGFKQKEQFDPDICCVDFEVAHLPVATHA